MPERLAAGDDFEPLVRALGRGGSAIIPTDTVYGLVAGAHLRDACDRLMALKGRDTSRPAAVLCATVDTLFTTALPELYGRAGVRARRLLPGPVTLVVPNPGGRFRGCAPGAPTASASACRPRAGARRGDRPPRRAAGHVGQPHGRRRPAARGRRRPGPAGGGRRGRGRRPDARAVDRPRSST
jgi:hypothetical protein